MTGRRSPIVVVEGVPGAGKTTAIRLAARSGLFVVPEVLSAAGSYDHRLSRRPCRTLEGTVARMPAVLTSDLVKHEVALAQSRAGRPVVMDRNYSWTLAIAAQLNEMGANGLLDATCEWFVARRAQLPSPALYVVVDVPLDVSVERRPCDRSIGNPMSFAWRRAAAMEWWTRFCDTTDGAVPRRYVDGTGSPEEVAEQIAALAHGPLTGPRRDA